MQPRHTAVCAVVATLGVALASADERAWVEARSPNFAVYSDAGAKQARRVAWQFEQIRGAFQKMWPRARVTTARPMLILALRDEDAMKALLPQSWKSRGGQLAGLFWRGHDKQCLVLRVDVQGISDDNPYHVLYHEYAHHLLDRNFQRLPLWLNEGLAEFYGATVVRDDAILQGKLIPMHVQLLREERQLPIDALFRVDRSSPEFDEDTRRTIFYAQSWALVHYLLLGSKDGAEAKKLVSFLDLLNEGVGEDDAARRAFGDPKDLGRKLDAYVRRFMFLVSKMPATSSEGDPAVTVRTLKPAEAAAVRGDFHVHTGDLEAARSALGQALKLDPDVALAHEAMGGLLWRERKPDQGRLSLERAVALEPGNAFAHYLLGVLTLSSGDAVPDRTARAQASLQRAVELNGDLAPACALLADVAASRGQDLEQALSLAVRAAGLEPKVADHRLVLGRILRLMARTDEARAQGERSLALADSDSDRKRATQFLESLSQPVRALPKDPAAAVAILERRCAAGEKDGCADLADRLRTGEGIEKDDARAAALYLKSCDAGHPIACAWLASAHAAGRGVPRDEARALEYNEKGCDGGNQWSCAKLAWALDKGTLRPRDDSRAALLYEKACEGGEAWACGRLGWFHQTGRAVAQDFARAASLYQKACEKDDASGCTGLGWLHENGRGVEKDEARAATLYEKGCDAKQPDANGCFWLAGLHLRGVGVAKDESRAMSLLQKACAAGLRDACQVAKAPAK